MKKFLIILLALLFALPVEAAEFTVTQDDSGVIIVTASAGRRKKCAFAGAQGRQGR